MQKNEARTEEPIEDTASRGSKRKRRETACKDKRRDSGHCGLCGSNNVAYQGVISCNKCGAEKFFIEPEYLFAFILRRRDMKTQHLYPCGCTDEHIEEIQARVCLDCGAVGAETCPVCRDNPKRFHSSGTCWTSKMGAKFCQACGLRTKGCVKSE